MNKGNEIKVYYNGVLIKDIINDKNPVYEFLVSFFPLNIGGYKRDLVKLESKNEYYISEEKLNFSFDTESNKPVTFVNLDFRLKQQ